MTQIELSHVGTRSRYTQGIEVPLQRFRRKIYGLI